jgi:imidazolonepropionase
MRDDGGGNIMKLFLARTLLAADDAEAATSEQVGMAVADGIIRAVAPAATLRERFPQAAVVEHAGLLTPGLVDAHTHAPWMGSRAAEYGLRMAGAGYEAIARSGGGIVASMRALREASVAEIRDTLEARLRRMASLGVTCVEVKSGYGLDEETERKQLLAVAALQDRVDLPRLVPTYLALHALDPTATSRGDYAKQVLGWLEGIAQDKLCRYVDAYIDREAFQVDEARPVLERARELGLGLRVHAGQFADVGAVELACALEADSVDHLEQLSSTALAALEKSRTAAVLLPIASFTLQQEPPPIAALRQAGVPLVVASDANPGTAPSESLPLAMALAVRQYGLSPAEAILGATKRAADSLRSGLPGISHLGSLVVGAPADFVLWRAEHLAELVQPWGLSLASSVYRAGRCIAGSPS